MPSRLGPQERLSEEQGDPLLSALRVRLRNQDHIQQFPPSSEMAADKTRRPALKISGRMDASLQSNALMKLACSPL
ncbi:hypothetical protein, partial [Halochromatium glycolicum]